MKSKYIFISILVIYLITSFIQLTFDFTLWSIEARVLCAVPIIPMIFVYIMSNIIND